MTGILPDCPQSYPQLGQPMSGVRVVPVALPVPVAKAFSYLVPNSPSAAAMIPAVGTRVRVPFGRRSLIGLVVGVPQELPAGEEISRYKAISEVLDAAPLAPSEWLESLRWAASYYQQPLGEVIGAALPARLREGAASDWPPPPPAGVRAAPHQ